MRIPSKGRYAVAALIDMAMNHAKGPLTIAEVAEKQNISLSYLEQLFADMRKAQLIKGMRGPGGGYVLARDPAQISIAQVIEAVEQRTLYRLPQHEHYEPFRLWEELSERLYRYLDGISLADCLRNRREPGKDEILVDTDELIPDAADKRA